MIIVPMYYCCSVAKSCPTVCKPHGLQHTMLPYPSLSPGVCSSSCSLNQWCYPTVSSAVLFSFCFQSFPASGSFPVSQFFTSGGQSIGASAPVPPMSIQDWFPLRLTGLIFLLSKGLSRVFSAPQFKDISSSVLSLLYSLTLISVYDYWKNHSFDYTGLCQQNVSVF